MIERMGRIRRGGALVVVALITLLVWGCEGTHGFAPVELGPEITDLLFPSAVESGQEVSVAIRALGLVRVDSIVATFQVGSYEETQVVQQTEGILADFAAQFDFTVPVSITDTLATVETYAVDAQHNVGPLSSVTLRTVDTAPPTVGVSVPTDQLGVGTDIPIQVVAVDNIGLTRIGFQLRGPDGEILDEVLIEQEGASTSRTLLYSVPMDLPLGDAVLVGVAVDHEGLVSLSDPVPVRLVDVDVPEVQVVTPDPGDGIPAQDSVFTQVLIRDNDAVDSVTIDGVAHRGDRELGTDTMVVRFLPRTVRFGEPVADTLLQRFLTPAADSTGENAYIRAVAYDREGNASRDSVLVDLLIDDVPPSIDIRMPEENQIHGVGDSLLVRTIIRELPADIRSGVTSVRLEGLAFRGNPELGTFHTVERFVPRTVTLDPPRVERLGVNRYLTPTSDATSEPVYIIATATDAWGNQRADTVRIRMVHDTIAPTILISEPDPGVTRTAGDSVLVSATVFETTEGFDQSGVRAVTVDGVSYRSLAGNPLIINKFESRKVEYIPSMNSVGISFYVQPLETTLEDVWIRVFARDALGNATRDSVQITLTAPPPAPPAPEIGMLDRWLGGSSGGPAHPGDPRTLSVPEVAWRASRVAETDPGD